MISNTAALVLYIRRRFRRSRPPVQPLCKLPVVSGEILCRWPDVNNGSINYDDCIIATATVAASATAMSSGSGDGGNTTLSHFVYGHAAFLAQV